LSLWGFRQEDPEDAEREIDLALERAKEVTDDEPHARWTICTKTG